MAWCVSVNNLAKVEDRLERKAVDGNRTPEGSEEIHWKQIGVKGVIADGQLPYFIHWVSSAELHPSARPQRKLEAAANSPATTLLPLNRCRLPEAATACATGWAPTPTSPSRKSASSGWLRTASRASCPSPSPRRRAASFCKGRGGCPALRIPTAALLPAHHSSPPAVTEPAPLKAQRHQHGPSGECPQAQMVTLPI